MPDNIVCTFIRFALEITGLSALNLGGCRTPHPPLRALCQHQPRREHRDGPRTIRRHPACRRPATAARWHAGCATCAALLVPALWRSHDRHRGVRARLPAEVAPDAEQDRHVMSQTFPVRCGLPVPMRWFHAGGDPSRPIACISAPMARCCAPSVRRNGYCTLPDLTRCRQAGEVVLALRAQFQIGANI